MQQFEDKTISESLRSHIDMLIKMEEAGYAIVQSSYQGFFERNWENSGVAKFSVEYHSQAKRDADNLASLKWGEECIRKSEEPIKHLKRNGCDMPLCPKCGNELRHDEDQYICVRSADVGCGWRLRV